MNKYLIYFKDGEAFWTSNESTVINCFLGGAEVFDVSNMLRLISKNEDSVEWEKINEEQGEIYVKPGF